jgi:hypothetical protein
VCYEGNGGLLKREACDVPAEVPVPVPGRRFMFPHGTCDTEVPLQRSCWQQLLKTHMCGHICILQQLHIGAG